MVKRVSVAAVGIPAALYLVYLGGWALGLMLALLAGIGALEVYRLAERAGVRALVPVGVGGAIAFPLGATAAAGRGIDGGVGLLLVAAWVVAVMMNALQSRAAADRPLDAVAVTVFGAIYAGALPSFLIWLRQSSTSAWGATWLVFLPLVVTWICDTFAMFGGSLIGGRKLAPALSPGKTWSGAVIGAISAGILAPLYGTLVLERVGVSVPLAALVLVGLAVGTLGQMGDLVESLFKREAGVKDSGTVFPGHGGMLDRLDSLYVGIPVTVLILRAFNAI